MTLPQLMEIALTLPAACAESPFGPESICVRLGAHGRIFAHFMPMQGWASFKCEPNQGMDWRQQYPGTVRRGWHCPPVQQPYNNTVTMDGTVPDQVLLQMLHHSYRQAVASLTRTAREELLGTLRPYAPEEEALVQSWIADERTYLRWSAGSVGSWPLQPGMLNRRLEASSTGTPFVWQWEGRTAGFVMLYRQLDVEGGIRFGYVALDPVLRGRGLGKRLVACAAEYAQTKLKAQSLHLSVYTGNPAALRCYTANGFRVDDRVPVRVDTCMGESWECCAMCRP